ncbi:hypothetical protein BJX70DRAFT_354212 [Aspergillus crustosus]
MLDKPWIVWPRLWTVVIPIPAIPGVVLPLYRSRKCEHSLVACRNFYIKSEMLWLAVIPSPRVRVCRTELPQSEHILIYIRSRIRRA